MAKQLELRRGTTQANNLFTGATGELTMDTDTKQLRVHDGVKTGGYAIDTLVAFQAPTAGNNYTWYRKYASGWVEQGGLIAAGTTGWKTAMNIALPVEMANDKYNVSWMAGYSDYVDHSSVVTARTTTYFTISRYVSYQSEACWEVKGMAQG